jgi:hypothetical protein
VDRSRQDGQDKHEEEEGHMLPSTIIKYICLALFVFNILNVFVELVTQHRAGWHTGLKNKSRKHRRETRRGRRAHATLHNYNIYMPTIFCC